VPLGVLPLGVLRPVERVRTAYWLRRPLGAAIARPLLLCVWVGRAGSRPVMQPPSTATTNRQLWVWVRTWLGSPRHPPQARSYRREDAGLQGLPLQRRADEVTRLRTRPSGVYAGTDLLCKAQRVRGGRPRRRRRLLRPPRCAAQLGQEGHQAGVQAEGAQVPPGASRGGWSIGPPRARCGCSCAWAVVADERHPPRAPAGRQQGGGGGGHVQEDWRGL
jgi:hypothetical protein